MKYYHKIKLNSNVCNFFRKSQSWKQSECPTMENSLLNSTGEWLTNLCTWNVMGSLTVVFEEHFMVWRNIL